LLDAGIVTNRNSVPRDPNGAWYTSGIRIGTPALTTLGMGPDEMDEIADLMVTVFEATQPAAGADGSASKAKYALPDGLAEKIRARAADLLSGFPLYPTLDLG
jgi:glycine hydroxymethyltransferase